MNEWQCALDSLIQGMAMCTGFIWLSTDSSGHGNEPLCCIQCSV